MAAPFEVVVRPVVFPDIRPQRSQSLPPLDDPEKGFCEINGNGVSFVSLPYSFSASASTSKPTEVERRFDEARVYQKDKSGKVNKKNFVDVQVANRIKMKGEYGPAASSVGEQAITGSKSPKGDSTTIAMYYARQLAQDNIEIKKKDEIRKKEQEGQ
jgi:hypothetical protein